MLLKFVRFLAFPLLAGVASLQAVQVRALDENRHNRFTGFPTTPAHNPSFLFGSGEYTGIGWDTSLPNRQFALVSPRHFLCATHYRPPPGTVIRFLNAAGSIVDRVVAATYPVTDNQGNTGDLTLGVLTSALGSTDGITPFPYLNPAAEDHARGLALEVLGRPARAGRGSLQGFIDLELPGIDTTRSCYFVFRADGSHPDDCRLESGDSGAPTFARIGGRPALVGTHSAIDIGGPDTSNFDAYVPHYVDHLNALMAELGHAMQPALANPAAITSEVSVQPPTLRRATPATLFIDLANPSAHPSSDVTVDILFDTLTRPDSITPPPTWTTVSGQPGQWKYTLPSFETGASARFTALWARMPAIGRLNGELRVQSSAAPDGLRILDLPVSPSYAEWSEGLADPRHEADPDGDGVANLLEYAFGGDPTVPSHRMAGGPPLLPQAQSGASGLLFTFPKRADSASRGLSHVVEFSTDLTDDSWTEEAPTDIWEDAVPFEPPVPGFLCHRLHCATEANRVFCRVRVQLAE